MVWEGYGRGYSGEIGSWAGPIEILTQIEDEDLARGIIFWCVFKHYCFVAVTGNAKFDPVTVKKVTPFRYSLLF